MTFQYFFFDTYVGDFLQVVPVALLAGAVCLLIRRRLVRGKNLPFRWPREITLALFVCYLAGLWGLVLTPNNLWTKVWYFLFYHRDSGNTITWLVLDPARWTWFLAPSLLSGLTRENLGNVLLFLPMGVFLRLLWPKLGAVRTAGLGLAISLVVELWQMVIGRSLDANDLILNTLGTLAGCLAAHVLYRLRPRWEAALAPSGRRNDELD